MVSGTKRNRHQVGDLWINGQMAWPDQSLEFVAYGTSEPTRSKFAGLVSLLTSSWHWPLLLVDITLALTALTLVPVCLVAAAIPRPLGTAVDNGHAAGPAPRTTE